jgi:hypothetical protein
LAAVPFNREQVPRGMMPFQQAALAADLVE